MAPTEVKARLQSAKPKRRREEELDNEEVDDEQHFCARPRKIGALARNRTSLKNPFPTEGDRVPYPS